ncbi:hypothetical protein DY218_14530, partial [Streptomyces triticagri]
AGAAGERDALARLAALSAGLTLLGAGLVTAAHRGSLAFRAGRPDGTAERAPRGREDREDAP